jgi:chromosome segregation ATPase
MDDADMLLEHLNDLEREATQWLTNCAAYKKRIEELDERIAELEAEVLVWKRHWKDKDRELLALQADLRKAKSPPG